MTANVNIANQIEKVISFGEKKPQNKHKPKQETNQTKNAPHPNTPPHPAKKTKPTKTKQSA